MSKKHENNKEKHTYMPIMEMYFEEEDSSDVQNREYFSEILTHEDIKLCHFPHITGRPIDNNSTDDEKEENDKDEIPKPPMSDDIIPQTEDAREEIENMISKDDFYPFGCKGMKKNIVTTNK